MNPKTYVPPLQTQLQALADLVRSLLPPPYLNPGSSLVTFTPIHCGARLADFTYILFLPHYPAEQPSTIILSFAALILDICHATHIRLFSSHPANQIDDLFSAKDLHKKNQEQKK